MDIKKVAKFAGVSIATVSRVINKSGPVSEKTKNKVINAIETLEYRPNTRARELRTNKSNAIITILNDIRNPIFADGIKGMEDVAYENGYHLLVGNTGNSRQREQKYIEALKTRKADGAIIITPRISRDILIDLSNKVPIVLMNDHMIGEVIPSVGINDYAASYDITKRLIEEGHIKIGCISGNHKVCIATERRKGFEMALKDSGIPVNLDWVFESEHTFDSGFSIMKHILSMEQIPTALVCYNDEVAIGVMKCSELEGVSIPEQLSVVGFDNISTSTVISPPLTTVHQHTYDIGRQAVEMLLSLIHGEKLEKRRVVLDYELIIRESIKRL